MKYISQIELSLLLIFSLGVHADTTNQENKVSAAVSESVNEIANVNVIMSRGVGYAGTRPKQYDNFVNLKSIASKDELITLTDHPNPAVRCYAFWALTDDSSIDLYPIILDHLDDTEIVETQFGCIGGCEMVGDFFIGLALPSEGDDNKNSLTKDQVSKLYNLLLTKPNELYAKDRALSKIKPSKEIYPRILELVIAETNQTALVVLAQYQKEKDIPIILNNREKSRDEEGGYFHTYRAISHFPNPTFLPLLEANLNKTLDDTGYSNEWRELYKAIASFQNTTAVELLRIPFTEVEHKYIREYHLDYVYNAIREFKHPIYDELLWDFWKNENIISLDTYNYLCEQNPKLAYELTKKSLQNARQLYEHDDLVAKMLNDSLTKDRSFTYGIIRKQIMETNVHQFPVFAGIASEIKDPSFVEALFVRLENEDNPNIYLKATKALLNYNDKDIYSKALETVNVNTNLSTGWGGEAFRELLKENSNN